MKIPRPQPGLVICYSYLWAEEHSKGREEGVKDRPCAIIATRQMIEGKEIVTVVPITHSPPSNSLEAVELPVALKVHLRMDDGRYWIILSETNDFLWPGPDLRHVPGSMPPRFDYGMLPPRFFNHIRDTVIALYRERKLARISRSD